MPVPDDSGTIRNQGFHDQQLALEWIHENIEKFGGDASKVCFYYGHIHNFIPTVNLICENTSKALNRLGNRTISAQF